MSSTCTAVPIAVLIKTGDRKAVPSLPDQSLDAGPGMQNTHTQSRERTRPVSTTHMTLLSAQLFKKELNNVNT